MDRINNQRIKHKFEQARLRQRTVGGESQSLLLDEGTLVEDYIQTNKQTRLRYEGDT